ncbi:TPA: peptidase, partial [Enterococcus faecalis]|nr:peptidase [Enterococcus faecalis]
MKKNSGYLVFLLALIFLASPNSVQAQQVDSDVGITFYQKSYKDQIIPMKKVINDQKKDNLSLEVSDKNNLLNKLLPKTNEKQE